MSFEQSLELGEQAYHAESLETHGSDGAAGGSRDVLQTSGLKGERVIGVNYATARLLDGQLLELSAALQESLEPIGGLVGSGFGAVIYTVFRDVGIAVGTGGPAVYVVGRYI